MLPEIPEAGAAAADLVPHIRTVWIDEARKAGIDLTGFAPDAPLTVRLAWAKALGLDIAGILSRFSTKLQQSTKAQVEECLRFAAHNRLYVPPEFVCVDEAVSGRKSRRDGLDRMRKILRSRRIKTLLVFKVSRLFRVAYKGYQFFAEELDEEGLRGISVTQGIDTACDKVWKPLATLHGMMDEMLLSSIADFVRNSLTSLFKDGFVTGALTLGYDAVEVPGGRPTKLGKPRKAPQVNHDVGKMILQHYTWIRDSMPIQEGWRRWVAAGGPCDRRSRTGRMTYSAYRRMLSNARYIGIWAFGRKRNQWSTRRDYTLQLVQPETEVAINRVEELRIVPDDLFFAVQAILARRKNSPRGPKRTDRLRNLWDLVTDCFHCAVCRVRLYTAGAGNHGMGCKHGVTCPAYTIIRREPAVRAVCERLTDLLQQDADLIELVVARAVEIDASGDERDLDDLAKSEKRIRVLKNKLDDLLDLVGQGGEDERSRIKGHVRAVQVELASEEAHRSQLQHALANRATQVSPLQVRQILTDLTSLLLDGAAGKLGQEQVYRAAEAFRLLVGGNILVHVDCRAGRKRMNARGVFRPDLIRGVQGALRDPRTLDSEPHGEVEVWLRQPPKRDQIAERVHQLMDLDGLSYREAAKVLQREGHNINSGVVWQIYRRYFEMIGQPVPKRPYNNGRLRKSRGDTSN